jgi:dTDP-4-amino-4,6-dideoxygalactose transaminase
MPNKFRLIPRYNWDYGLKEFFIATGASLGLFHAREDRLTKFFQQEFFLTTSGRASLYAILKSLSLPSGAGVGVPLFCCSVVFDTIQNAGLKPVFLDIDLDDFNISPAGLKKKVSQLSAVVVVHMFGHPADMEAIKQIAPNIPIIEDCAQSLFSKYKGRYTGYWSDASFFSFRSGKYLSAGEGSVILCSNSDLSQRISQYLKTYTRQSWREELLHGLFTYAKSTLYKRPWYGIFGYPIGKRLDKTLNLTAKTGLKLSTIAKADLQIITERIDPFFINVQRQRENALYLIKNIQLKNVYLPIERQDCLSNYYQFAIRFHASSERDHMAKHLWERGIDSAKYLDDIVDVAKISFGYRGDCPSAEIGSKTTLTIPHYYSLKSKDLEFILKALIFPH